MFLSSPVERTAPAIGESIAILPIYGMLVCLMLSDLLEVRYELGEYRVSMEVESINSNAICFSVSILGPLRLPRSELLYSRWSFGSHADRGDTMTSR